MVPLTERYTRKEPDDDVDDDARVCWLLEPDWRRRPARAARRDLVPPGVRAPLPGLPGFPGRPRRAALDLRRPGRLGPVRLLAGADRALVRHLPRSLRARRRVRPGLTRQPHPGPRRPPSRVVSSRPR